MAGNVWCFDWDEYQWTTKSNMFCPPISDILKKYGYGAFNNALNWHINEYEMPIYYFAKELLKAINAEIGCKINAADVFIPKSPWKLHMLCHQVDHLLLSIFKDMLKSNGEHIPRSLDTKILQRYHTFRNETLNNAYEETLKKFNDFNVVTYV